MWSRARFWWRLTFVFLLGVSLSLGFTLSLKAQTAPSQLVRQAQEFYRSGKFDRSLQLLERVNKTYKSQAKFLQQAQTFSLIAQTHQQMGNWQSANQNIAHSFESIATLPPSRQKTRVLAQIWHTKGHSAIAVGQNDLALADWHKAEELYREVGDRLGVVGSLLNRSQALEKMGFYNRSCAIALEAFDKPNFNCEDLTVDQIQTVINEVKTDVRTWKIQGLNQLSNILLLKGELKQAEILIEASESISQNLPGLYPSDWAKINLIRGNIDKAIAFKAREWGEQQKFIAHAEKAVQRYQNLIEQTQFLRATRQYRLPAQLNLLSLLVATQQWSLAQNLVSEIELQSAELPSQVNLYGKLKFALFLEQLKDNRVDVKYSWQDIANICLEIIEQTRAIDNLRIRSYALGYLGTLTTRQQHIELDSTPLELISDALKLSQQIGAAEIAFRWQRQLGQIYARADRRDLAIANYRACLMSLKELRQDLSSLTREIQYGFYEEIEPIYQEYADLLLREQFSSDQDLAEAIDVIESLQVAELDNYFQDACTVFESIDINQIDRDAAAIYTIALGDRLEIILAMKSSDPTAIEPELRHYATSISRKDLEQLVQKLRLYITEPDRTLEVKQLSARLYDLLIRPLEADLNRQQPKNLVFVLDAILQTIPMSVLYDGDKYLLEKYAISITPGLRMLNLQDNESKPSFMAGGISQPLNLNKQKFSALKNVESELSNFSETGTKVLLNQEFTPENLLKQINSNSASYIHLATHGKFNSNSNQSFLLMWKKLLTVKEFSNILQRRKTRTSKPIELLVLSACDTALGDRHAALGLGGVAVRSGALTTVATLWQVNDESTAALMQNFYRHLRENHSKADALSMAQRELWDRSDKDWKVPAFWSGYIAIGNW
ncbi:MAG: CHAT domain-containing protein [Cyanobacteria bacterium P01_G01_bin.19]